MTKSKLAIFLDSLSISVIAFFLSFVWVLKYIKNAFLSFFICILLSICLFLVIFYKELKKYNLLKLNMKDLNFSKKCYDYIINLSNIELIKFYSKLTNSTHVKGNIFKNEKFIFYINLNKTLTENDFIEANSYYLNSNKLTPLCFLGKKYSDEFLSLLSLSINNYIVYDKNEIYLLMKNQNIFPISSTQESKTSNKNKFIAFKTKFFSIATKDKFKDFFISGISLIVLSIFIPYSIYYMIFGSILLLLSLFCLLSKSKPLTTKDKPPLTSLIKKDAKNS
jgi:hypothetical protein